MQEMKKSKGGREKAPGGGFSLRKGTRGIIEGRGLLGKRGEQRKSLRKRKDGFAARRKGLKNLFTAWGGKVWEKKPKKNPKKKKSLDGKFKDK